MIRARCSRALSGLNPLTFSASRNFSWHSCSTRQRSTSRATTGSLVSVARRVRASFARGRGDEARRLLVHLHGRACLLLLFVLLPHLPQFGCRRFLKHRGKQGILAQQLDPVLDPGLDRGDRGIVQLELVERGEDPRHLVGVDGDRIGFQESGLLGYRRLGFLKPVLQVLKDGEGRIPECARAAPGPTC